MVNIRIASRFSGPPSPPQEGSDREACRIDGPIYSEQEVVKLLQERGPSAVRPVTKKCIEHAELYDLDDQDHYDLVLTAIQAGRYNGSAWCLGSKRATWFACDAYTVVRREYIEHAHREMDVAYYIKFAIGASGIVVTLVSCHPSRT